MSICVRHDKEHNDYYLLILINVCKNMREASADDVHFLSSF